MLDSSQEASYSTLTPLYTSRRLSPFSTSSDPAAFDLEAPFFTVEEERATRRLLESWMERLQLISVLTIFFASVEATLLSITIPSMGAPDQISAIAATANTGLMGGLVLHILAAFISFLGGFFLVRYKIKWARSERNNMAKRREYRASPSECSATIQSPITMEPVNEHGELLQPSSAGSTEDRPDARFQSSVNKKLRRATRAFTEYPITVLSTYFNHSSYDSDDLRYLHGIPTKLLGRFHVLCVALTLLGFIFTLVGIVCTTWGRLPHGTATFCTAIIFICLLIVVVIFIVPDTTLRVSDINRRVQ